MRTTIEKTAELGDLVAAAFDDAAQYSTDPREVSRLAAAVVRNVLGRPRGPSRAPVPRPPLAGGTS